MNRLELLCHCAGYVISIRDLLLRPGVYYSISRKHTRLVNETGVYLNRLLIEYVWYIGSTRFERLSCNG